MNLQERKINGSIVHDIEIDRISSEIVQVIKQTEEQKCMTEEIFEIMASGQKRYYAAFKKLNKFQKFS